MGNSFYNWSTILKFMKLKIIILLVLLTQILTAQKGARIGYIDMDLILENIDEYKIAKKIIDKKIEVWKKEIELQKIQLKRYQDELNSEKVLLTQELIADRNSEINDFASGIIFCKKKDLVQMVT